MGKWLFVIIVAVLLGANITGPGCDSDQAKPLGVKDVLRNMLHDSKPVTIMGIVVRVSSDNPKEFALMDVDDARTDQPGRDEFYLPVVAKSHAPKAGEVVKVTGILMEHGQFSDGKVIEKQPAGVFLCIIQTLLSLFPELAGNFKK